MKKITLLFFLLAVFGLQAQTDTVTFSVDMNSYTGTFTTVHINGTWNAWCGTCNPMADPDQDGVWDVSLPISSDTLEYKFTLDGWTFQESLTPGSPCTVTNSGFTNRSLIKTGDTTMATVCWEACGPCGGAVLTQADLPLTFDDPNVNYATVGFGGCLDSLMADPTDPTNNVIRIEKPVGSQTWAGVDLSSAGLANPIPFASGSTEMKIRFWSPDAGIEVRLKVEQVGAPTISVETVDTTTVVAGWDTLTFDFSNQASGTAAISFANTYDKVIVFPNFGVDGATAGNKTYYVDDVMFVGAGGPMLNQADLPLTFDDPNVAYITRSFGGCVDSVRVDPTDPNNNVVRIDKPVGSQTWAGVDLADAGLANPIPFASGATTLTIRFWSPDAGIEVRLKVEDATDPTISVETVDTTAVAGGWDTLTFDMSTQAAGTAAINFASTYDKVIVFPNFGVDGNTAGDKTYFVDDVYFGTIMPPPAPLDTVDLPITFDDPNVNYTATAAFGGCSDTIMADPTNSSNNVMRIEKSGSAETWGGITVTAGGMKNKIPFTASETGMRMRVWSPDANTVFLLKVEDATNSSISAESSATTTMAGAWETLTFDLSNTPTGTPAFDPAATYDVVVVFPNFGTAGSTAGAKTYYVDDIEFAGAVGLNESNTLANWTIAPNPSSGLVRLEGLNGDNYKIQVSDLNGRLILDTESKELNQGELYLNDLNNGIYLITVGNEYNSVSRKLIITK